MSFLTDILSISFQYVLDVLILTGGQILLLLGPLIFFAFINNMVSSLSQGFGLEFFGRSIYLYVFAWLGIAIHEISHAIFVVLFGHKIEEIVLFSPKSDGTLGYVIHSYNKKNPFHNIGNFFIGLGPVLIGPVLLYFILIWFLGSDFVNNIDININLESIINYERLWSNLLLMLENYKDILHLDFNNITMPNWKIGIFLFVLFSIGSSISMSNADIKGAWSGFIYFVALLIIFNLSFFWYNDFSSDVIIIAKNYISIIYPMMIISILLNLFFTAIFFVLSFIRGILL